MAMLKQTRWTILLSLNAAAILVAGILIARAIGGKMDFRVVGERSDETNEDLTVVQMLDASTESSNGKTSTTFTNSEKRGWISSDAVAGNELWNETTVSIFQSADIDICVGGDLENLGEMYWQTSDSSVISGFYSTARTWLGYSEETCRYPIIKGTGTTTITAGTYDGTRRDTITVTVKEIPTEQWKREVLSLVNEEREENGLGKLSWGTTCEVAAALRARELMESYSHTRPDGSEWSTACPIPDEGGWSGENLMAGNASPSPALAVEAWMNSEKHRENILNPNFTKLSVGLVFDPDSQYQIYWSQYFTTY